jgi:hypothetical protein
MDHLPQISDYKPSEARVILRCRERAVEIIRDHAPDPDSPKPIISPLQAIKIDTLAHLTALIRLHEQGADYHRANANLTQAQLWSDDAERLQALWSGLLLIQIA